MGAALRLLPLPEAPHRATEEVPVEDRALDVIDELRRGGRWKPAQALRDGDALRETLQVVGEFDLDLLVRIAADAIEAEPART